MSSKEMNSKEMNNKELIIKFYEEVFNSWDLTRLDDYMSDTYMQHNANVKDGKEGFREFAEKFLAMKPHAEIVKIICEDDLAVVFFKCTMQENGMVNKVFDMYRIEDGKLAEHWDCVEHDIGSIVPANGRPLF